MIHFSANYGMCIEQRRFHFLSCKVSNYMWEEEAFRFDNTWQSKCMYKTSKHPFFRWWIHVCCQKIIRVFKRKH